MSDSDQTSAQVPKAVAAAPLHPKQRVLKDGPIQPGETQAAIERMEREEEEAYRTGRKVCLKVPTMFPGGE